MPCSRQTTCASGSAKPMSCRTRDPASTSSWPLPRPSRRPPACARYDIAKRLIDHGYHPPTIYFPLIVEECLLIEPTETESLETLDAFAEALIAVAREAHEDPELLTSAPHDAPVRRLDETAAAREPGPALGAHDRRGGAVPG